MMSHGENAQARQKYLLKRAPLSGYDAGPNAKRLSRRIARHNENQKAKKLQHVARDKEK